MEKQGFISPYEVEFVAIATDSDAVLDSDTSDLDSNNMEETADIVETTQEAYSLVYEEAVINRLDNMLVMDILSACFLFLIFYYAIKRR